MSNAEVSGNGSGVGVAGAASEDHELVGWLIGLLSVGLLLVLIGAGVSAVFDMGSPDGAGLELLVGYGSRGLGTLGVAASFGMVVFGILWTAFHVMRGLIKGLSTTVRFVVEHSVRHLVGSVAPAVLPVGWFIGFSLLTGGTDAIGYWLLATLGSILLGVGGYYIGGLFLIVILDPVGDLVGRLMAASIRRFGEKWAERVKVAASAVVQVGPIAVVYSLAWVHYAAQYSGATPARLPWTEAGWGQYLGFVTVVTTTWGMGYLGSRLHDRWTEPDAPTVPPTIPCGTAVVSRWSPPPAVVATPADTTLDPPEEMWSPQRILAWRAWIWGDGELRGVWKPWTSVAFEAECGICDEVPGWDHTCGIYAVKQRWKLHVFDRPGSRHRLVIGVVALSGLVVEHDTGYRAQHARIVELIAPASLVEEIRLRYPGVRVAEGPETGVLWPT